MHKIRVWDKCAADRVDYFIANSHYIAQRIKKYYRRDSDVIYPCCHINESPFVEKEDFYLTVGRLTWYKRVDLAMQACAELGERLVVMGSGGEMDKLKAMAGPAIEFKGGGLTDEEVRGYYLRAPRRFCSPARRTSASPPWKPRAPVRRCWPTAAAAPCETVMPGKTGYWFEEQGPPTAWPPAIQRFAEDGVAYRKEEIREHSRAFSEERFERENEGILYPPHGGLAAGTAGLLPLGEEGTDLNPIVINGTVLCDNITGIPRYVYADSSAAGQTHQRAPAWTCASPTATMAARFICRN